MKIQGFPKLFVLFEKANEKKNDIKLLITSATISAALPFAHLIIGTVPEEIKKLNVYCPFLDKDNCRNFNLRLSHRKV